MAALERAGFEEAAMPPPSRATGSDASARRIEAAVYFSCLEALQGTLILVRARNRIGWLFDVAAVAGLSLTMTEVYLFLHASSKPELPGVGYAAIINQVSVFPC